jgi:hypothetical protein
MRSCYTLRRIRQPQAAERPALLPRVMMAARQRHEDAGFPGNGVIVDVSFGLRSLLDSAEAALTQA